MTHEGRMARGEIYFNSNNKKLLDNADLKYFLANRVEEKPAPVKEVKKVKKETKKDDE